MSLPRSNKPDPLLAPAKVQGLARRRRSALPILLAVAVLAAGLTTIAWLAWPGPDPVPLIPTAFDVITFPNEVVTLRAQLQAIHQEDDPANLAGHDLYFIEPQSGLTTKSTTGRDGAAAIGWRAPGGDRFVEVLVRYPGDRHRRGSETKGRVFLWPQGTPILVVDADHTLAEVEEAKLWSVNNLEIAPLTGAKAALQTAQAKHRIVYLSAGARRPALYAKLRSWLAQTSGDEPFPVGPLLAPAGLADQADVTSFLSQAIAGLKQRYEGEVLGVVSRVQEALLFHDAGLRTFLLTKEKEVPEGVTAISSWAELQTRLAPG